MSPVVSRPCLLSHLASDKNGLSDPYVKVLIGPMEEKTEVVKRTLNPRFTKANQFDFRFDSLTVASLHTLTVHAYDYDLGSFNDSLGFGRVAVKDHLAALDEGKPIELVVQLEDGRRKAANSGTVHISLGWVPDRRRRSGPPGILGVHLARGAGLRAADSSGLSDPYVKLSLGAGATGADGMLTGGPAQRSEVVKKTLDPVWENAFSFPCYDLQAAAGEMLSLEAFDHDVGSRNDSLGVGTVHVARLRERLQAGERCAIEVELEDKGSEAAKEAADPARAAEARDAEARDTEAKDDERRGSALPTAGAAQGVSTPDKMALGASGEATRALEARVREIKSKLGVDEANARITADVLASMVPVNGTLEQKLEHLYTKRACRCSSSDARRDSMRTCIPSSPSFPSLPLSTYPPIDAP